MYKDLMVPIISAPGDSDAINAGITLAAAFDAHLRVVEIVNVPTPIGDPSALSWIQSAIIARSQSLTDAEPMIEHIPLALRQLAHEITGRGEGRVPTFGAPQDRPLVDRCFALPTARPPADAELTRAARKVDRDFTRLSRTLGRNRYLVTLACAGVSELAWTPAAPARLRTLHVVEWFAALGAQLANAPAQSREDAIISRVFDLYQGRHEHGCGLPGACAPHLWSSRRRSALRLGAGPSRASRNTFETFRGPAGWALQLRLLWHLAVVGHPVEADVLATAPMVQKDCLRILGVEDAPYLNGMAEAIGEARRRVLDLLREGRVDDGDAVLSAMEDLYAVLVTMDYPDAITGNLRRSTDVARSLIEKTRGDLAVARVSQDLHDALDRHRREVLEKDH